MASIGASCLRIPKGKIKGVRKAALDAVQSILDNLGLQEGSSDVSLSSSNPNVRIKKKEEKFTVDIASGSKEKVVLTLTASGAQTVCGLQINVGKNAAAQIILDRIINSVIYEENMIIQSAENSIAKFTLSSRKSRNMRQKSCVCLSRESSQERDSKIVIDDVGFGFDFIANHSTSNLQTNSEAETTFHYALANSQICDATLATIHVGENSRSTLESKGVLNGESKSLSTGNIVIERNARGSSAYETQNAILLSDTARADAIPKLEIKNHDVKCSHGSTITRIDPEQIFYLQSRGIARRDAVRIVVTGMFVHLFDRFPESDTYAEEFFSILLGSE